VEALGGCGEGSPEVVWLRQDLAAHVNACIIAFGHHALFSSDFSAKHARHIELRTFWQDLYAAQADLVLAGHEHSYPICTAGPERASRSREQHPANYCRHRR
jgi:acid phosphatase type 7